MRTSRDIASSSRFSPQTSSCTADFGVDDVVTADRDAAVEAVIAAAKREATYKQSTTTAANQSMLHDESRPPPAFTSGVVELLQTQEFKCSKVPSTRSAAKLWLRSEEPRDTSPNRSPSKTTMRRRTQPSALMHAATSPVEMAPQQPGALMSQRMQQLETLMLSQAQQLQQVTDGIGQLTDAVGKQHATIERQQQTPDRLDARPSQGEKKAMHAQCESGCDAATGQPETADVARVAQFVLPDHPSWHVT
jgi:hypothetical protein